MAGIWVQVLPIILSTVFAVIGYLTYRLISGLDRQIAALQKELGPLGKDLKEVTKELHGVQKELEFIWRVVDEKRGKDAKSDN